MSEQRVRPLSIAILAIGGQGGGVLTKWLVDLAEANGYLAQSTYVAGVAQRTGATVYCVEILAATLAAEIGREPVFTPYPVPGDVDLVVVGEMAETGRAIQKGFVTPNVTTLIASSHRIYSIAEKAALGDGIVGQSAVVAAAGKLSKRFVCFDMNTAALETGSVISSVLLGAIAHCGVLPFDRSAFESTIRESGMAVEASLRGFAAGFERAGDRTMQGFVDRSDRAATNIPPAPPAGVHGEALAKRIETEFPQAVRNVATHGALRALDYQDQEYATSYLTHVTNMLRLDRASGGESRGYVLTAEVARQLALQMCYEDTLRVADLKTRRERFRRIRDHVAAKADQPVHVVEYFHPRLEEFCDTLPASAGSFVLQSKRLQKILSPFFRKGRNITTTNIGGFILLSILARLKTWRRGTYRFLQQSEFIDDWLQRVHDAASDDYEYALSIAKSIEIVKGYGDTYQRGLERYRAIIDKVSRQPAANRAGIVRRLHAAALADEEGRIFTRTLESLETVH